VNEPSRLRGGWVTLEPVTPLNWPEVLRLDQVRGWNPNLGGAPLRGEAKSFGPAMIIRDNSSADAIGTLENTEMAGYPGVAAVLIYVDESVARPGIALEAFALYVSNVFAAGARLVHVEILEFNRRVIRMLRRIGLDEQARQRDHVYVAGRFWDVVVYSFDAAEWERIWSRYAAMLPGGGRRPAALGGSRKS